MGVLRMRISLQQAIAVRDSWSCRLPVRFMRGYTSSAGCGQREVNTGTDDGRFFSRFHEESIEKKGIKSSTLSLQFPELSVTGLTITEECASWGADTNEILESTALNGRDHLSPLSLSRGELKRLHLACVLARNSDLLMLDEPFSSLDCREKAKLCDRIRQKRGGITVIFTHEQSILPHVDRIWEISEHTLVDCGRPPDAFFRWRHVHR